MDGYDRLHPGGKFVLNRNVGRDISKFFYGGYSMVNYPGSKPFSHPHTALEIAESLVVGVMENQHLVKDTRARITGKAAVTNMTNTFTFTEIKHNIVPNWKVWYMDLNMIGRHFLVYSEKEP